MSPEYQVYSVDQEIIDFFQKTSTDRSSCDDQAQSLVGGTVTPVAVQGVCSYSVYTGLNQEYVVQFRLKSLGPKPEIVNIASSIYGSLVPSVSYHGQIGLDHVSGKEPLLVYVMGRVKGISHLDFILEHSLPENSPEFCTWRENLISDIARYACSWLFYDDYLTLTQRLLKVLCSLMEKPADCRPILLSKPSASLRPRPPAAPSCST